MTTIEQTTKISLAWNFNSRLIARADRLNKNYGHKRRIVEVYGALPNCPVPSARPSIRLPNIPWEKFVEQVRSLQRMSIAFNYLINTGGILDIGVRRDLRKYITRLSEIGVRRLTIGTPKLISWLKDYFPSMHMTLSITYGVKTKKQLYKAVSAGADAVYLDATHVNRDFKLLRSLLAASTIECRLYANVSCINKCPVVREHYMVFARHQDGETARQNDIFFTGCSLVKARNSVEWIQAPWIRPEDIGVYEAEGVRHFKLSDRLADSKMLEQIAKAYLIGRSPENIFHIIERGGTKYGTLAGMLHPDNMQVRSSSIPDNFIQHYRNGECSKDPSCSFCRDVAKNAVRFSIQENQIQVIDPLRDQIPRQLLDRTQLC